ncbi:hypothetical protein JCM10908_003113 [Rhodotorula pacifica]|uniref:uncharacterized protein n=1 Tax=Rhodotorula pacifica TaxID=1495444 RepID=UPI003171AB95
MIPCFGPILFWIYSILFTVCTSAQSAGPLRARSEQLTFASAEQPSKSGPPVGQSEDLKIPETTIVRKEVCFRDLYTQPAHGVPVLVADGVHEFGNGTQAYKVDHCYPQDEPLSVYDYLAICPLDRTQAERAHVQEWKRGLRLQVDQEDTGSAVPVFDEPSFLEGFVLPQARAEMPIPEESLDEEEVGEGPDPAQTSGPVSEDPPELDLDAPFNPQALDFDETDFAFFAAFENGYPGQDGCDEYGCWERKIVTGA